MRVPSVVLLCWALLVASERLRDLSQASWQAWLLLDSEPAQGEAPRRITPKSVFITPSFTPQQLPACAEGYRADALGRCVRVVRVDQAAHISFLLRQLNAAYAAPKPQPPPSEEQPPLQVSLPITNYEESSSGGGQPDLLLNIWELDNDTSSEADQRPKGDALPMLIFSHKQPTQGADDEAAQGTEAPGADESEPTETLLPNESKKQIYSSETNSSAIPDSGGVSNGTEISEPGTGETGEPVTVESPDDAKETSSSADDNIVFTISTSVPQQTGKERDVETFSAKTLPADGDKIVFADSSDANDVESSTDAAPSSKNTGGNHPAAPENGDVVQSAKRFLPENHAVRIRNDGEAPTGDVDDGGASKTVVRFPSNEGSHHVRFPSDASYRNVQQHWWYAPQSNWRPSYPSQPFVRYQSHGPEYYQRYYGQQQQQQAPSRYAGVRYRRRALAS